MERNLNRKWTVIDEHSFTKIEITTLDENLLKNPLSSFPQKNILNKEEVSQLQELENQNKWIGEEFLKLRKLQYKRGLTERQFEIYQKQLEHILAEAQPKGLKLPKWFITFFRNFEYVSRFKFSDISFWMPDGIVPFPNYNNYHLIPFLGDSQGFCWWSILIDDNSNYCIVYRDLHWRENPDESQPKEFGEYYVCSDTFEEFLVRLSIDTIVKLNGKKLHTKKNTKK